MFIKVDLHAFREQFKAYGRANQFSYQGLETLFDYLEGLEHCEEPYELDVIALCCDFSESDALTIANDYSVDIGDYDGVEAVREYLEEEGALVGEPFEGTFVYRSF